MSSALVQAPSPSLTTSALTGPCEPAGAFVSGRRPSSAGWPRRGRGLLGRRRLLGGRPSSRAAFFAGRPSWPGPSSPGAFLAGAAFLAGRLLRRAPSSPARPSSPGAFLAGRLLRRAPSWPGAFFAGAAFLAGAFFAGRLLGRRAFFAARPSWRAPSWPARLLGRAPSSPARPSSRAAFLAAALVAVFLAGAVASAVAFADAADHLRAARGRPCRPRDFRVVVRAIECRPSWACALDRGGGATCVRGRVTPLDRRRLKQARHSDDDGRPQRVGRRPVRQGEAAA